MLSNALKLTIGSVAVIVVGAGLAVNQVNLANKVSQLQSQVNMHEVVVSVTSVPTTTPTATPTATLRYIPNSTVHLVTPTHGSTK